MMIKSSKPRYQRKYRMNAPMHARQHFLHVHIDKALKAKLKLSRRTIQISKGDTVKVMSGAKKGQSGKVASVSLRTGRITLQGLSRKNARGKEQSIFISASNVYITDLNLTDKYRAAKLKLTAQPKAAAQEKREEKKETQAGEAAKPGQAGAQAQSAAQVKQQVQAAQK